MVSSRNRPRTRRPPPTARRPRCQWRSAIMLEYAGGQRGRGSTGRARTRAGRAARRRTRRRRQRRCTPGVGLGGGGGEGLNPRPRRPALTGSTTRLVGSNAAPPLRQLPRRDAPCLIKAVLATCQERGSPPHCPRRVRLPHPRECIDPIRGCHRRSVVGRPPRHRASRGGGSRPAGASRLTTQGVRLDARGTFCGHPPFYRPWPRKQRPPPVMGRWPPPMRRPAPSTTSSTFARGDLDHCRATDRGSSMQGRRAPLGPGRHWHASV